MDPSARLYALDESAHERAFTAYSIRFGQPLAFDQFQETAKRLSDKIRHQPKDCEIVQYKQEGYLAIPGLVTDLDAKARLALDCNCGELPPGVPLGDQNLPTGLLRVTFAQVGVAKNALVFLLGDGREVLNRIFNLIEKGRSALKDQRFPAALAIADLNSNLLRYRNREYQGLDALAAHLQTLFGECECSIFRASPVGNDVHLYLAATTALSANEQHVSFRKAFLDRREHYTCARDPNARGDSATWAKTERAYYLRGEPVYDPSCKGKGKFGGLGEWKESTSFLALAIPSRLPEGEPYGVIRLVRGSTQAPRNDGHVPFTDDAKRLAAAIATTLNFWLEFFPRNDALEIGWASQSLRLETLRTLFHIRSTDLLKEAAIEFEALLRKLFVASSRIRIQRAFSGYSGAAVLLVQSDAGPEIILKCAGKVGLDASAPLSHENPITSEVSNYNTFVQGKIRLNHNIIYPDTIRETRRVNGFVSSFVGSGLRGRRTLAEFAASDVSPVNFFHVVSEAVSQIIEEVWQWWYEQADKRSSESVAGFLQEGLHREDIGWHLAANRATDLENLVFAAAAALNYPLHETEFPVAVLKRFLSWSAKSGEVQWQECVTHGDLHGGNIFLDPHSAEVWLIDFARTGKRASIFDLATLEAHIMFQLLPSLLKARDLLDDRWAFVETVVAIERVLVAQRTYGNLTLPEVFCDTNLRAVETLRGAVRAVTNIRLLLHDALGRRGKMTDYLVVLFLQSFRYMNVRGASDADSNNLRVLLAALASHEVLNALMRTD